MLLLPLRSIVPARLLSPPLASRLALLSATASAPTATPRSSSVPPLATLVPDALLPRPLAWVSAMRPALMRVLPP
jgi:hypothetical protein